MRKIRSGGVVVNFKFLQLYHFCQLTVLIQALLQIGVYNMSDKNIMLTFFHVLRFSAKKTIA